MKKIKYPKKSAALKGNKKLSEALKGNQNSKKPKILRKTERIHVNCTVSEKKKWTNKAARENVSISSLIRMKLNG